MAAIMTSSFSFVLEKVSFCILCDRPVAHRLPNVDPTRPATSAGRPDRFQSLIRSRVHGRVYGRIRVVRYTARPVHSRAHGLNRPCTWLLHGRVQGVYTCTRPYTRPCSGRVHICVRGLCQRPRTRPWTSRVHGRLQAVYTACTWHARVRGTHVYTETVYCTRPCTGRVH